MAIQTLVVCVEIIEITDADIAGVSRVHCSFVARGREIKR